MSDALWLDAVQVESGGRIGMTLCPGKVGPGRHHTWQRGLDTDLAQILDWGAGRIVTLMEAWELNRYAVPDLGKRIVELLGPQGWHHLPIVDGGVPDATGEATWNAIAEDLHQHLDAGGQVCIHCLGGLGRTGVIACKLLIERGVSPKEALNQVRSARHGAVETSVQELYVRKLQPRPARL